MMKEMVHQKFSAIKKDFKKVAFNLFSKKKRKFRGTIFVCEMP